MADIPDRGYAADVNIAYVARQPIVDRTGRMAAYELLFRDGPVSYAYVRDDFRCTAEVVERAIGSVGFETLLGGLDGYINCSADFLFSNIPDLLPGDQIILEVLETCELNEKLKERCNDLRVKGFRVALDDVRELTPEIEAFLSAVDIVKLDWPAIAPELRQSLVTRFKGAGKVVVAEKVDERAEWLCAVRWGCDLVQGFYFSKPQVLEERPTMPQLGTVMQVLDLLINDASDEQVIRALASAPVLAEQLLRVANCSGRARTKSVEIVSLHHALAIAGTTRLFHWCTLLLYNHPDALPVASNPLLLLATQRAEFMEHLALAADEATTGFAQTAYLTGMLSLLHLLHAKDQLSFLCELAVAPSIRSALLERRGELGTLLLAAEEFERGRA